MKFLVTFSCLISLNFSTTLFSAKQFDIAPYLDSIGVFDSELKYTKSGDTIFIRYFDYGHVLEVVNGRLTRIIPYNSAHQKNGFEFYISNYKRNQLYAKFYENGKVVHDIPYVTLRRRDLEDLDSAQLSEGIKFDPFAINDTLNNTFQHRFYFGEYNNSHYIWGSDEDHHAYIVFVGGEIKLIGILKSVSDSLSRLNRSCFIFHDYKLQYKLNFKDNKLDGEQSYFVEKVKYKMHYADGKFVSADSAFYNQKFYKSNTIAYKLWSGNEPQLKIDFDYFQMYVDQYKNDIQWRYYNEYYEKQR